MKSLPPLQWSRLKHPPILSLLIASIIAFLLGIASFTDNIAEVYVFFDLSLFSGIVRVIFLVVCLFINFGCGFFGFYNALSGRFPKYVEIFHWMEFVLIFTSVVDALTEITTIGFFDAFGGVPGFVIAMAEVINLIAYTIAAELTERIDKKAALESK